MTHVTIVYTAKTIFWKNEKSKTENTRSEIFHEHIKLKNNNEGYLLKRKGSSPEVQWLGTSALNAMSLGSIPGLGTKISQVLRHSQLNK